jgi:hypothetical protein
MNPSSETCIVYVLAVVLSFIVVFLYCVFALFVCNVCYLSVVLLYYCHRAKAQLQFNRYIYIYIYINNAMQSFERRTTFRKNTRPLPNTFSTLCSSLAYSNLMMETIISYKINLEFNRLDRLWELNISLLLPPFWTDLSLLFPVRQFIIWFAVHSFEQMFEFIYNNNLFFFPLSCP